MSGAMRYRRLSTTIGLALLCILFAAGCGRKKSAPVSNRDSSENKSRANSAGSSDPAASQSGTRPDTGAAEDPTRALLYQLQMHLAAHDYAQAEVSLEALGQADGAAARKWRQELETRRNSQQALDAMIEQLGDRDEQLVAQAMDYLRLRPERAQPLLLRAMQQRTAPVCAGRAIQLIAELYPGVESSQQFVAVLESAGGRDNWSDAVRGFQIMRGGGAGERLLTLALEARDPRQRAAGLRALAVIDDPPRRTLVALLPTLLENHAHLDLALTAAAHAAVVHGQFDLEARRAIPAELLAPEVNQQLDELPAHLEALGEKQATLVHRRTAQAARRLALALGLRSPEVLTGVQVASFAQQLEASPASALLDGVWKTTEPPSMWRHNVESVGEVVIDLGSSRTLSGLRVWNLNEAGAGRRGWKQMEIRVGDSPADAPLVRTATVPRAPGTAEPADYSIVVPLPFPEGRYVTLRAVSVWERDGHSGLTEIQLLGF